MRELVYEIINSIKKYAEENKVAEGEVLNSVIYSLINYITMSSIEPIIIKKKEVENE
jgi:hypothetical protein